MRLIDADELKKHIGTYDGTTAQVEAVEVQYIDNAPTVDTYTEDDIHYAIKEGHQVGYEMAKAKFERPQGEWISVSERLPDYMDDILITFQKPNREPLVYRAIFIGGKFALDNGDTRNWNDPEVKAWMSLPEAYKEVENEI